MDIKFLNVDLEVESTADLSPLVAALGDDVVLLHIGPADGGGDLATFELAEEHGGPDGRVLELCDLIEHLPPEAAELWRTAHRRTFDVGYECGDTPRAFQSELTHPTIRRVADLGASLTTTIYPRTDPEHQSADDGGTGG
jgi:hypothetical protein